MRLRTAALVICALSFAPRGVWALDQRDQKNQQVLPAFDVVSSADSVVASSRLSEAPRWLLIYVAPACGSCDRLVSALTEWQRTLPASRLVVVIQAASTAAREYAQQHGLDGASGVAWFADRDQSGSRALGLQRVPSLVAVDSGRISWVVTGVLNDPGAVESAVRNWVGY